jgi:predicted transcriptional regulator
MIAREVLVAPHLGDLETAVMGVIWQRERVTVREVLGALRRSPAPGYTTVATIMHRLVEKGLLRREREGRLDVFHPTCDRAEYERRSAAAAVHGLVAAYGDVALAQFAAALQDADPDLLARLRARVARPEEDAHA